MDMRIVDEAIIGSLLEHSPEAISKIWLEYLYKLNFLYGHLKHLILGNYPNIFLQHRFWFIAIPKAASTSISHALGVDSRMGVGSNYPVRVLRMVLGNNFHNFFKFCFVRHPVDRLLSAYTYMKKGGTKGSRYDRFWQNHIMKRFDRFEDFVFWLNPRRIYSQIYLFPQTFFISINGKVGVDFVGRVENIDSDFRRLLEILQSLGFKPQTTQLSRMNASRQPVRSRPVIEKHVLDRIYTLYKEDFDLLGYDPEEIPS